MGVAGREIVRFRHCVYSQHLCRYFLKVAADIFNVCG